MTRFAPLLLALSLGCSPAHTMDTSTGNLDVTRMVDQLDAPWALGFLPEGGLLITERGGGCCMSRMANGARSPACHGSPRKVRADCSTCSSPATSYKTGRFF